MKSPAMPLPHRSHILRSRQFVAGVLIAAAFVLVGPVAMAQGSVEAPAATEKFSPDVVAKAEAILDGVQLRRAGKVIQSTNTSEVARAISGLARSRRELKLVYQDWKQVGEHISAIDMELKRLNIQYGELNLQLARIAGGDVTAHNRLVGLVNAGVARTKLLESEKSSKKELLATKRVALNAAESAYAETVLAIRSDYKKLKSELDQSLLEQPVQIALRVMRANFETPEGLTADAILSSIDKRLQRIEQEVFSETIKLDVVNNSLYVDVVVGRETTRMVVDSGANLISLPSKTASDLGIVVPSDAPQLRMILADGREIPARAVTLARVRVGEFEAENVEAAVLDEAATNAEPLLGMSFLGKFKFEIDQSDKSLKMLRVNAED
ncbi:TIGR02281 family clan AA aspartic protease [Rubripirellula tenax]|nr:TIGR02281 family clan AA aspartic protease [Rubripirellula tenax]